ncbi:hypothetical protein FQA47_019723 [Oryzias melastigma]|uniref:Uncharacterized protein n=1 Tax=Oryzias melastigma TaxID=30732 RepID=A0A834FMP9_ORYME|nr:hypothetical protein FQA47_019723 [Oryzias melastigma]
MEEEPGMTEPQPDRNAPRSSGLFRTPRVEEERDDRNRIKNLPEEIVFKRNARILITEMLELNNRTQQDTSMLVEEILHSVFFLGQIYSPSFSPRSLLDDDMFDALEKEYPQPFQLYSTRLPRRSPFSCLLEMVVCFYGQENEDQIRNKLKDVVHQMKEGSSSQILFSSTICISHTHNSCRYYGVSMSTRGRSAGEILVAASCFSNWHRSVSDAVMTYYPDKQKKSYFSRNMQLPPDVKCEVFNISEGRPMDLCRSCSDLFGLDTTVKKRWGYGHCAEAESLSNLFKGEPRVIEQLKPEVNANKGNRMKAKMRVLNHLKQQLKKFDTFKWDGKFYPNPNPK